VSTAHGLVLYGAMADVMKGWTLSEQGREQEGIDLMREGLAALEATATTVVDNNGERYYEAELYRLKGELLLKKDKRADAERCFERSLEIAKSQKAKSLLIRTEMSRLRVSSGTLL